VEEEEGMRGCGVKGKSKIKSQKSKIDERVKG
jgi:hypothetical protein